MSWIWLNKNKYPEYMESNYSIFMDKTSQRKKFIVVSFKKEFFFELRIKRIEMEFAYDTSGYLTINNELISGTNNKINGDFLSIDVPINKIYLQKASKDFIDDVNRLNIEARVELGSTKMWDFSSGFGGFYFIGKIFFEDGSVMEFETDESWLAKLETSYNKECSYDSTLKENDWDNAKIVNHHWDIYNANIKIPKESDISFDNHFLVNSHSKKTYRIDFPIIYAAYYLLEIKCSGLLMGNIETFEIKNSQSASHYFKVNKSTTFRYMDMVSAGGFILKLDNKANTNAEVIVHVLHSQYPYSHNYQIHTNNKKINDLFSKCKSAVGNCSQTIYLDSPKHLEPMASCAGDYNIISLVNAYASGDFSLAKHHLKGYADYLKKNNGVCINTSYGLILSRWLKNIYMFTGDKSLLIECVEGCRSAIDYYLSTLGENGLVEKPCHYAFVDWINVDGINLHSPSKNLGQSVICMFLYDAIKCLEFIYTELSQNSDAKRMHKEALKLKNAINTFLFNKERGLYIAGLNTPQIRPKFTIFLKDNSDKIYFLKHENILAALYGIAPKKTCKRIIRKIFCEDGFKDLEVQPYFMHYLFEAIHQLDMDKQYFKKLFNMFLKNIKQKDKGLPEGFYRPHPSYVFDYSHAWASTPFYSFINASSGLKILEPGMKTIRIKPVYLGVDVKYVIPTPFGNIEFEHQKGKEANIVVPKNIKVIYE